MYGDNKLRTHLRPHLPPPRPQIHSPVSPALSALCKIRTASDPSQPRQP
ncbi:hypothetical protein AZE42_12311, partial [Rhizopogon vesiculosus]